MLDGEEIQITQDHPRYEQISQSVIDHRVVAQEVHTVAPLRTPWQEQIDERQKEYKEYNNPPKTIDDQFPIFTGILNQSGEKLPRTIRYIPGRKDQVIQRLYEDHTISFQSGREAILTPLRFAAPKEGTNTMKAPHFVQYIKESILNNSSLGLDEQQLYQGGYKIMTTLNLQLHDRIQQINKDFVEQASDF